MTLERRIDVRSRMPFIKRRKWELVDSADFGDSKRFIRFGKDRMAVLYTENGWDTVAVARILLDGALREEFLYIAGAINKSPLRKIVRTDQR